MHPLSRTMAISIPYFTVFTRVGNVMEICLGDVGGRLLVKKAGSYMLYTILALPAPSSTFIHSRDLANPRPMHRRVNHSRNLTIRMLRNCAITRRRQLQGNSDPQRRNENGSVGRRGIVRISDVGRRAGQMGKIQGFCCGWCTAGLLF